MDKIFVCQQCLAELSADEVDGVLGHPVPDYDDDGDVYGCRQCGPCQIKTDWALTRIKGLESALAAAQDREAMLNRLVADLQQQLAVEREANAKLRNGIIAVDGLIAASGGVYGLHLNGYLSPWSELCTEGQFEAWLIDFDNAMDRTEAAQ